MTRLTCARLWRSWCAMSDRTGSAPVIDGPPGDADAVVERVRALAPYLRDHADEVEAAGRVSPEAASLLRETGIIRLLQPKQFGGYEADPRLLFGAVMDVARSCGATGWVCGIVGVHPWELGVCDLRVQHEIWDDDPDTWAASTYMPTGRAKRVDGGYELTGRWSFSSGIDVATWVILGGLETDADGSLDPTKPMHFFLQDSQYQVVEGSWDVVGLSGTGSKDVTVSAAFVPDHRTLTSAELIQGRARGLTETSSPVYRMPWSSIYPTAISASVLGASLGALDAAIEYQRTRVSPMAGAIVKAPVTMSAIARATGEIEISVDQVMTNLGRMWEIVAAGEKVPVELRSRGRRDQVQACWRAVRAVDDLFDYAGGGALRRGTPLQRFWRDAHAGLHHAINTAEQVYQSAANVAMGLDPSDPLT